jgi:hypothetical protein
VTLAAPVERQRISKFICYRSERVRFEICRKDLDVVLYAIDHGLSNLIAEA